jgi:glycosyltransferase involved in cell wall biosynthesis
LTAGLDHARFDIRIVALKASPSEVAVFARDTGRPVESLGMRGPFDALVGLARLRRLIRAYQPDIIQSWLYHADLLAGLARSVVPSARLIWSVRNASLAAERRWDWTLLTKGLARISPSVDLMIANADAVLQDHVALGYRPIASRVIPNGWDTPPPLDPDVRAAIRARLGLTSDQVAVLMPARFAPQKDHATFCAAAGLARQGVPTLRFFAAGEGVTPMALHGFQTDKAVEALGPRDDIRTLMTAMDAIALTSAYGEGCPNGLGEAMARGVPVIATAVGGVPHLVGETGLLVPPGDPRRLSDAFKDLASRRPDERERLGQSGRARIAAHFQVKHMLQRHVAAYVDLAKRP